MTHALHSLIAAPFVLRLSLLAAALLASGCATNAAAPAATPLMPALRQALEKDEPKNVVATPAAAPAPKDELATVVNAAPALKSERRFSLVLNNTSAEVLFMALLNETPLSVAVDPSVKGPFSIALKDVTLREALELLRELHNLEYKVIGRHILVSPAQMQTRIFTVNYPSFNRSGRSDLRVVSGSITSGGAGGSTPSSGSSGGSPGNNAGGASSGGSGPESSRITTSQRNDLWTEIEASIKLMIGDKEGRQVVVSPQTGNIVVRALPREMRAIAEYLEASRSAVQRQVMLESKVVEVQLRDTERTGINWAAFKAGLTTRASGGVLAPGASLAQTGAISGSSLVNITPGAGLDAAATNAGALLGLAFQTTNFAAVLEFLGTQGNTQVLSSPRIATMNNQKALLKVGTDDFFVTNISTTSTPVGNTAQPSANITVQPFFSGISLDVTPQIDAEGFITLHIHPAVSNVTERNKVLNLGSQGSFTLPLASSDINETDAVVRARDGHIIAIGGLMRQASVNADSGVPGTEGSVFRKLLGGQSSTLTEKRELVILLKPTIIDPSKDDGARQDALGRLLEWTEAQAKSTAGR
jgi:MSHA biogenesis protein MshL